MDSSLSAAPAAETLPAAALRRFALPNGVELHGVIDGAGPPLVFIHGAMGDWRSFESQWPAFTPHFTCLSYSRRAMKTLALSSDEFPWLAPERLAALPMPVLLMSGADTQPVHAEIFRNVCAAMPQARPLRVAGAGHALNRDAPAAFNAAVLAFLRSPS